MELQDKITALQDKYILVDAKFRDGKVWMRGVTKLSPRNNRDNPSEAKSFTCDTFEECVDKLIGDTLSSDEDQGQSVMSTILSAFDRNSEDETVRARVEKSDKESEALKQEALDRGLREDQFKIVLKVKEFDITPELVEIDQDGKEIKSSPVIPVKVVK